MLKGLILFLVVVVLVLFVLLSASQFIQTQDADGFFSNPFLFATSTELGEAVPYYRIPDITPIEISDTFRDHPEIAGDWRTSSGYIQGELVDAEEEYDFLQSAVEEAKNFGTPSPYRGQVRIIGVSNSFSSTDPSEEYVTIEAAYGNSAPVDITGWSLQSVASRTRYVLPQGVASLGVGAVQQKTNIVLDPGNTAIVTSGISPVGVSFRENSCTGYLDQFQHFLPTLDSYSCPSPSEELPVTAENLLTYGEDCLSFVSRLQSCRFYTQNIPPTLPPQCRDFVRNALTYNGCVSRHGWRPSFVGTTWRVFLGRDRELWRHAHDIIRLIDAQGRTVDAWTY